jgi:hypothetical protein
MIRFVIKVWRVLPSLLAGVFVIVMIWLFVVFPRVVNLLADVLGNMGDPLIPREQFIHTVVALVASLVPLYWLIIRPFRQVKLPQDGSGLIVRQGQGKAYIDGESVRNQVYRAVKEIGGIKRVEVSVESDSGRADILLNLITENNINGGRKKQEIRREVKKVVEDQLGVQLAGEPTINFRLEQIEPEIPQAKGQPLPAPRSVPPPPAPVNTAPVNTVRPVDRITPSPSPVSSRMEEPSASMVSAAPVVTRRPFVPTERIDQPTADSATSALPTPEPPAVPAADTPTNEGN